METFEVKELLKKGRRLCFEFSVWKWNTNFYNSFINFLKVIA